MKSNQPRIASVPLHALRPNPDNPRTITPEAFERLKASLVADPHMLWARPVIALSDGTIVGGNMRYRAAYALGWDAIPTVLVDMDETAARQWVLRDNASYGAWEEQALAELLYGLKEADTDLDLTGLGADEVARCLEAVGPEGEEPEVEEPPDTDVCCPSCGERFDPWVTEAKSNANKTNRGKRAPRTAGGHN